MHKHYSKCIASGSVLIMLPCGLFFLGGGELGREGHLFFLSLFLLVSAFAYVDGGGRF